MSTTFPIDVTVDRLVEFYQVTTILCQEELGRAPSHTADDPVAEILILMALEGQTGDQLRAWLHAQPEAVVWRERPKAPPIPPKLPFTPFRGAFCIPGALPGIPYGDRQRIWTPAFGCYDREWQVRMLEALIQRGYTWIEIQISGRPYRDDYPELAVDPDRVVRDLILIREHGLRSIISFDDDARGGNLSYLQPIAAVTQDLVDCTMGIYEANGVFNWDENLVASVLEQTKRLWPDAINAFHSTSQDNGGRGFGERTFWLRVAPFTDVYFIQQSAWTRAISDTADRARDFCVRLIPGANGWPALKYGVVLFEETTSMTYRSWSEHQGTVIMDTLMNQIVPRPNGYMDGGTVAP